MEHTACVSRYVRNTVRCSIDTDNLCIFNFISLSVARSLLHLECDKVNAGAVGFAFVHENI